MRARPRVAPSPMEWDGTLATKTRPSSASCSRQAWAPVLTRSALEDHRRYAARRGELMKSFASHLERRSGFGGGKKAASKAAPARASTGGLVAADATSDQRKPEEAAPRSAGVKFLDAPPECDAGDERLSASAAAALRWQALFRRRRCRDCGACHRRLLRAAMQQPTSADAALDLVELPSPPSPSMMHESTASQWSPQSVASFATLAPNLAPGKRIATCALAASAAGLAAARAKAKHEEEEDAEQRQMRQERQAILAVLQEEVQNLESTPSAREVAASAVPDPTAAEAPPAAEGEEDNGWFVPELCGSQEEVSSSGVSSDSQSGDDARAKSIRRANRRRRRAVIDEIPITDEEVHAEIHLLVLRMVVLRVQRVWRRYMARKKALAMAEKEKRPAALSESSTKALAGTRITSPKKEVVVIAAENDDEEGSPFSARSTKSTKERQRRSSVASRGSRRGSRRGSEASLLGGLRAASEVVSVTSSEGVSDESGLSGLLHEAYDFEFEEPSTDPSSASA